MVLPNQLTVLRIILTPVFLFFFLSDHPLFKLISLGIFVIAALTDWYDGWLARKFNYITNWGKFWDPLADKILTSSAFVGFVILDIIPLWMVVIIILRDLVVTSLRAYADYRDFSFPTSYYAKWKTFIQMVFLYYLLIVYTGMNLAGIFFGSTNLFNVLMDKNFVYVSMLIITAITLHSGVTYIYQNRRLIKELFNRAS